LPSPHPADPRAAQRGDPRDHRAGGQYRLAAERCRRGRVRLRLPGPRLAARARRGLPRLSGDPGPVARLRRARHGHQPHRRPQLHADRSARHSALGPMAATAQAPPRGVVSAELAKWPASLKIGGAMLALIALAGILAPWLAPYDPYEQDLVNFLQPPSWAHPFGTDMVGRDVFSRVLYGIRIDLQIGFFATYVPMTYGVMLGALAGYFGGVFDTVLM